MNKREVIPAVQFRLERLFQQVHQALLRQQVKGKPASIKDMSFEKDEAEIRGWYREIQAIMKELEKRKQAVWVTDYNAQNSKIQHWNISQKEWAELKKFAAAVLQLLDDLMEARMSPTAVSLGEGVGHLLKQGFKDAKHYTSYEHYLKGANGKITQNVAKQTQQTLVMQRNDHALKMPDAGAASPTAMLPFLFAMVQLYVTIRAGRKSTAAA